MQDSVAVGLKCGWGGQQEGTEYWWDSWKEKRIDNPAEDQGSDADLVLGCQGLKDSGGLEG